MKINISGLEVRACHGVFDSEKVNAQKFLFDAEMEVDAFNAAKSDDLNGTVNYAEVCALIEKVTQDNSFNLIEKLALECAFKILETYDRIKAVKLTCFKPEAPVVQKFSNISVTVALERVKAYLSLGSSLGDRAAHLNEALAYLNGTRGIKVEKVSEFIETEPYGGVAKNKFLNCAACVSTFLPPHALLDEIHRIENLCGRVRKKRWEDRTLDIDIIFYGDKCINDENLTVPHPGYAERDFVIKPLKSIAPHLFK